MKKLLIATAAMAVVAGAQAQSSVSVYGVLDASESVVKSKDAAHDAIGFNSSAVATSRLGFTGSEDLGGGRKATFNLESAVVLTGSMTNLDRLANVGLSDAKLGSVALGLQATPVYAAVAGNDPLGVNSLGFLNAWVSAGVGGGAAGTYNRLTNANSAAAGAAAQTFVAGVGYASPTFAGVSVKAFVTPGNNSQSATVNNGALQEVTANYTQGALSVTAGVGGQKGTNGNTVGNRSVVTANYTLGSIKLSAGQSQQRWDASTGLHNVQVQSAGVKYQTTPVLTLGAVYTIAKDLTTTTNKSTITGLFAGYDLSKRTQLYAMYGTANNNGNAQLSPIYNGAGLAANTAANSNAGKDTTGYAVGIKHTF